MKSDNIDLGKYDLNKLLRNPAIIHRIQDNLMRLKGVDRISLDIRITAKNDIGECIRTIVRMSKDNYDLVVSIIGKETMELINEFEGNNPNDIPDTLFKSQGIAFPDK